MRKSNARMHAIGITRDADGNRIYYTDPEADAKREESRQAMMAACGT